MSTTMFETPFEQSLQRANRMASQILRSPLGAHTYEDVVSGLIEKAVRAGKGQAEIQEMLSSSKLYRYLNHMKNDIYRWETAHKRGSDQPPLSYEEAEPWLGSTIDDPVEALERKEELAHMKDLLARMFELADLSETQIKILHLDQRGWSSPQIARKLELDLDAIYSRRSEALRKLAAASRRIAKTEK